MIALVLAIACLGVVAEEPGVLVCRLFDGRSGEAITHGQVVLTPPGDELEVGQNGECRFSGLSPGEYVVRAFSDSMQPAATAVRLDGAKSEAVDLYLQMATVESYYRVDPSLLFPPLDSRPDEVWQGEVSKIAGGDTSVIVRSKRPDESEFEFEFHWPGAIRGSFLTFEQLADNWDVAILLSPGDRVVVEEHWWGVASIRRIP